MAQQEIRLADGNVVQADVNGLTWDGNEGYVFLPPPGPVQEHFGLQGFLSAGREARVRLVDGQWVECKE